MVPTVPDAAARRDTSGSPSGGATAAASTCEAVPVLRLLRDGSTGGPARGVRLVALLVAVAMLGLSATALAPALRWLLDLL